MAIGSVARSSANTPIGKLNHKMVSGPYLHFLTELVKLSDPAEISDPTGAHSQDSIQGNALEAVLVRLIRHSRPGSSIVLVSDFWQLDQSC